MAGSESRTIGKGELMNAPFNSDSAPADTGAPSKTFGEPTKATNADSTAIPSVLQMERQGEYKTPPPDTYQGKRLVVLGFGFDAVGALAMTDCMKIINACRLPEDPRCACFEYVGDNPYCPIRGGQAGPETGSPEWFEAIEEIPFDVESDEETPII
jgi:hypothetical protein